jgi:hypothetical protein
MTTTSHPHTPEGGREPPPGLLTAWHQLAGRAWAWARLRRGARSSAAAAGWARRLAEEQQFLGSLIQNMEGEFLATGEGLERLDRQLGEIRGGCQELMELTLGRSPDAAVPFAFQLLKKAEDLVLGSYDQYDQVFATFGELSQRLAELTRQHDELMRVLLPINFITLAFRIEANRQPPEVQSAFFALAAGMNRTVSEVRVTLEKQFEKIAASELLARSLVGQISASIQQHRRKVGATLETSRGLLRNLGEALGRCQAGTTDLARLNESVNRHIGAIVMAQQCQDITRQKIEHVGEAMMEMHARLDGAAPGGAATAAAARQFVARAGDIQLQQVRHVFAQLNEAAESLKAGFHSLHTEAGAAAAAVVKVGGATLDAQVTRQCQTGLGEILDIVKQAVEKFTGVLAAFEPLQASFVDCTVQATTLAGDVRHAGLNAQVFAIHAPEGATLEVLAGRVRVISEEVIQQVGQMGSALNHTAELINNLRSRLEDFQSLGAAEEAILAEEAARSRQKLAALEELLPALIQRITRQQETFAGSVGAVLGEVRFPEAVAAASTRSLGFFEDLVAWSRADGAGPDGGAEAARDVERLQSNYTMASERAVHAAAAPTAPEPGMELFGEAEPALPVAGGPTEGQSPPAVPAMGENTPRPTPVLAADQPAVSQGLGDNVELF